MEKVSFELLQFYFDNGWSKFMATLKQLKKSLHDSKLIFRKKFAIRHSCYKVLRNHFSSKIEITPE